MWHHHQVCAGPNSPVPALKASIKSYIQKGANPGKLILGVPWCATCLPACLPACLAGWLPACLLAFVYLISLLACLFAIYPSSTNWLYMCCVTILLDEQVRIRVPVQFLADAAQFVRTLYCCGPGPIALSGGHARKPEQATPRRLHVGNGSNAGRQQGNRLHGRLVDGVRVAVPRLSETGTLGELVGS